MLGLLFSVATLIPNQVRAQSQPEPAVVVSIANLNEQLKDVKYLLTASGFPEFNFLAKAAIKGYTEGIDASRNSGVALYFKGDNPVPNFSGFVPVDDLELLLDVISAVADVEDNNDKTYTVVIPNGNEIRIKEKGGFAFFADQQELLDALPTEPEQMLGDNPSKYNLAFSVRPQAVPEALRNQVLDTIKSGSAQTLEQLDDELKESQQKSLELQMKQFEMILNDSELLMIGMAADAENKKLYTDLKFTAKAGSELAKKHNESKATKPSRFSGFLMSNTAMNFIASGRMSATDGVVYSDLLVEGKKAVVNKMNETGELSDAEFEKVEMLLDSVAEVLGETLKQGVIDTGMAVVLDGSDANLIGGVTSADPTKIESVIKDIMPMLKDRIDAANNPDVPAIKFNLDKETYEGIRFHEVVVSIDDEDARKVIGESIYIAIGFGADSVYYGFGTDPMPTLKKAMAAKTETEFSSELNLHLVPFLKFASRAQDTPPAVAVVAEQLAENGGDLIRASSKHIPNGNFTRFEMQGGILSLIKSGYESIQDANGNGF